MVTGGDHIITAFDEDMSRLRGLISEMGGRAEAAITGAISALVTYDLEGAKKVVADDAAIDKLEADVERLAVQIIGLRAPVADDLREVVAALKIASVVERIGDYAKNIARRISSLDGANKYEVVSVLEAMGDIVSEMVHEVLDAFAARSAEEAVAVNERDKAVDDFYNSIFRMLVTFMMENPQSISSGAHLMFIAKNLERIGDHATNVAEMVYYAAKGEMMPERERGESVLS